MLSTLRVARVTDVILVVDQVPAKSESAGSLVRASINESGDSLQWIPVRSQTSSRTSIKGWRADEKSDCRRPKWHEVCYLPQSGGLRFLPLPFCSSPMNVVLSVATLRRGSIRKRGEEEKLTIGEAVPFRTTWERDFIFKSETLPFSILMSSHRSRIHLLGSMLADFDTGVNFTNSRTRSTFNIERRSYHLICAPLLESPIDYYSLN